MFLIGSGATKRTPHWKTLLADNEIQLIKLHFIQIQIQKHLLTKYINCTTEKDMEKKQMLEETPNKT